MATGTIRKPCIIGGGGLGSGAITRTFSFSGTAKGLLVLNANLQSRCGLYILYGATGTPYYGTVLESSAVTISASPGKLTITTTTNVGMGVIWYQGEEYVTITESSSS